MENEIVEMKDNKWENPIQLTEAINKNYLFWPKSIPTDKIGETKTFIFQINIDSEAYEVNPHFFELTITSEEVLNLQFQAHLTHTCNNILLFKKD